MRSRCGGLKSRFWSGWKWKRLFDFYRDHVHLKDHVVFYSCPTDVHRCCGQLWVWHMICGQTCDGLYHFVFYLVNLGIPYGSLVVRLYSEIDHTYLSIEAQCVSHHYPRWTATTDDSPFKNYSFQRKLDQSFCIGQQHGQIILRVQRMINKFYNRSPGTIFQYLFVMNSTGTPNVIQNVLE